MKYVPREYQQRIIERILSRRRIAIWAGMGMGKTSATLTALERIIFRHKLKVLIIAPLRVAQSTWPDEVKKWDHLRGLRVSVIAGPLVQRRQALSADADIYTINYEQIPWLVSTVGEQWPFELVVADEATRLKSYRTRSGGVRAKALAQVSKQCKGFIELTGTPAPNGLLDLWGQVWFLDEGRRLGKSYSAYQQRFFYPRAHGGGVNRWCEWKPYQDTDEKVRELLSDISITINPEDYFDVAQNVYSDVVVDLPPAVLKQYRKFARELYLALENGEEITAQNAAVKTGKLLQMAGGAVYKEDSQEYELIHAIKIDALRSVLEEANGMPVLCAYSFKHEVDRILKAFPQAQLLDKNPQTIIDWNAGRIPLLLAHPASCGHGLNLQEGGNILVFFSCGWSLEQHDQIVERIGAVRQAQSGKRRKAFIYYVVARKTLDEAVKDRLANKRTIQDALLNKKQELLEE